MCVYISQCVDVYTLTQICPELGPAFFLRVCQKQSWPVQAIQWPSLWPLKMHIWLTRCQPNLCTFPKVNASEFGLCLCFILPPQKGRPETPGTSILWGGTSEPFTEYVLPPNSVCATQSIRHHSRNNAILHVTSSPARDLPEDKILFPSLHVSRKPKSPPAYGRAFKILLEFCRCCCCGFILYVYSRVSMAWTFMRLDGPEVTLALFP